MLHMSITLGIVYAVAILISTSLGTLLLRIGIEENNKRTKILGSILSVAAIIVAFSLIFYL